MPEKKPIHAMILVGELKMDKKSHVLPIYTWDIWIAIQVNKQWRHPLDNTNLYLRNSELEAKQSEVFVSWVEYESIVADYIIIPKI